MLGKSGATLTLQAFDFDVAYIVVKGNGGASASVVQNIFVGENAVSTATTGATTDNTYEIASANQAAGTIYTVKVTSKHNTQITGIDIYKVGTKPAVKETPKVDNIAAFKALGSGNKAILTLKDAQVQYVNGTNDMYIVDATGGIDIYKSNLKYTAGQILNGTIEATYSEYNKLPELTNITASDIKATDGTISPVVMTVEEAAKAENVCKLVTVKNITLVSSVSGSYTNYYNDANKTLQIYDKFKVGYTPNTESPMDYTGILIPYNSQIELAPTVAPTASTTGISNMTINPSTANAPAYNLAGQKVSGSYKGVVIKAGKKFVQK